MSSVDQLHNAEREALLGAPKFRKLIDQGQFARASAIISGIAISFSSLANAAELNIGNIRDEFDLVLSKIDDTWAAVEAGSRDQAISAYVTLLDAFSEGHERVTQQLIDSGSRGGSTERLAEATERAINMVGILP